MRSTLPDFEHIPARIRRLGELAYNVWWCWNAEARHLFRSLDRATWRQTEQNPVRILREISGELFEAASRDPEFLGLYDRVTARFDRYMNASDTWHSQSRPNKPEELIAYFCAEFALHTSVPIYSGGLGLLAGDTCKEASDLGLPFVAVGALYPEGYFRQQMNPDGSQEATYVRIKPELTPLLPMLNDDGTPLIVTIPMDSREINVAVWRLQAGRVPIYLMDTNIPENDPWDRDLVARLYGGDIQVRLRQEIILGIGGIQVLRALGYDPTVVHLNEGHAAFAAVELIREGRDQGLSLEDSVQAARDRIVFTTHTPVAAGHDEFPFHMIEEHFRSFWDGMGITREQFLELGTAPGGNSFGMTILALNAARKVNGVSRKHGEVSRAMWHFLYPDRTVEEVPILSITNGVHVPTWLSGNMVKLCRKYLGADWKKFHDDPALWEKVLEIPDEELWAAHCASKGKLLSFMQGRARARWASRNFAPSQVIAHGALLNPKALTIGFARRFATYKRANLIMRDVERLKRILMNQWHPVQLVFAGKAHPADEPGKFLLKQIYEACSAPEFAGRIAFVENYNKQVAHHLVLGVDVWLNNPVPPKEASGTSGEKASLNGVVNFSVLDGWWCEGYNRQNGWAIQGADDSSTAESIYSTLENEIVPLYYDRDSGGIPRQWVALMKEAIRSTAAPFSARRMMKEYAEKLYFPDR